MNFNNSDEYTMIENKPPCEVYTLVLKHHIWDGEKLHEFEEPLVVRSISEFGFGGHHIYFVREMMDKLTHEVIRRCGGKEE